MWRFLKKLEIELPYDPAIPLLGIYTEETRIERDTCTPMFIAALFIIARTGKQPRCPSADEWIRKLWYTYTMEPGREAALAWASLAQRFPASSVLSPGRSRLRECGRRDWRLAGLSSALAFPLDDPDIPVAPGEEHYVLDPSLDEDSLP